MEEDIIMAKCLINNTGNKGANGVMIQILNFFVSKGYTPTQACAIAGNISVESGGYKPNAVENGGKGEGIGLCQWSFSRKTALKDFTKNMSGGWQNVSNQLAYLWHELNNDPPYKDVGKHFENNKNKTIGYYTNYWCDNFEKPDSTKAHKDRRLSEAKKAAAIYEQLNKDECVVDTSDVGSSSNQNFGCNAGDGETLASDISIVDDSTVQTTTSQPNGNSSTAGNAKNNTVDTRTLYILDEETKAALLKGGLRGPYYTVKQNDTLDSFEKDLKRLFSDKLRKPKHVVIFINGKFNLGKNKKTAAEDFKYFVNRIELLTGYSSVWWFGAVSPEFNIINAGDSPEPKVKYSNGYIINQAVLQKGDNSHFHKMVYAMSTEQSKILDNANHYRKHIGSGKYVFTDNGLAFVGKSITLVKFS